MSTTRQQQVYDEHTKKGLLMQRELLQKDIEYKEHTTRKKLIHWNQVDTATKVIDRFQNLSVVMIMVLALTQSGKTGCMLAIIKLMSDQINLGKCGIDLDNVYIITGHSSKEWKKQTKNRMPSDIKVYHRNDLENKFLMDIRGKKNVLIICDEVHMAADKKQTIAKVFETAKLNDKQFLYENDIKIVEFTATPNGTLYDINRWGDASRVVCSKPGTGYTSCFDLLKSGRVHQFKDLCGYDSKKKKIDYSVLGNIEEIRSMIYSKYDGPRYHIIRSPPGDDYNITKDNFKIVFGDNVKYQTYHEKSDNDDINDILKFKPEVHTFVFIKEMCRCSVTLNKTHIGVVYERYVKGRVSDSVITQGLLGRLTGYDDNGDSICFTDIQSIQKLEQLWKSEYNDDTVKWNSNTTVFRCGQTVSSGTFNQSAEDHGVGYVKPSPNIKKFDGYDLKEIKLWIRNNVLGVPERGGPRDVRKPDKSGFYTTTLRRKDRSYFSKVATPDDLENFDMLTWGVSSDDQKKERYRVHLCYTDPTDRNTLQTWVVYKSSKTN